MEMQIACKLYLIKGIAQYMCFLIVYLSCNKFDTFNGLGIGNVTVQFSRVYRLLSNKMVLTHIV